jgi:hypothetical protein
VLKWENPGGSRPVGACLAFHGGVSQSFPNEEVKKKLTLLPVARPVSRSFSLSLSAAFRRLFAGAEGAGAVGSAGCFRFCARECSPVGVPVRVPGPLSALRPS